MGGRTYTTPTGQYYNIYRNITEQTHTIIAGSTGSGKSVVIEGIISTLLYKPPNLARLILIDPKRCELSQFARLPHTLMHASKTNDIVKALDLATTIMERRYTTLEQSRRKRWMQSDGPELYIIVDEFADIVITARRETERKFLRLAMLGRAAGIHLIIATQRPTSDIITGAIKTNIDCRLALRVPTAQDSRNILNTNGAEQLPQYGKGFYLTPMNGLQLVTLPMISPDEVRRLIAHWEQQYATARRRKK